MRRMTKTSGPNGTAGTSDFLQIGAKMNQKCKKQGFSGTEMVGTGSQNGGKNRIFHIVVAGEGGMVRHT